MAIPSRDYKITGHWAKNAETILPDDQDTGTAYRKTDMEADNYERGEYFDLIYGSARQNQKDYETVGIAKLVSAYGIVPWSPLVDYTVGAIQLGTDTNLYRCMRDHGPSSVGPKDPTVPANTGSTGYWEELGTFLLSGGSAGAYEAIPNTLALRNDDARFQAADPVHDLDMVNLRTLKDLVDSNTSGDNSVDKPRILSPASGYVFPSLDIAVTVSAIALTGGGTPSPSLTQLRATDPNANNAIAGSSEADYTTSPSLSIDPAYANQPFDVVVRHKDGVYGWSAWSDKVRYTVNAAVAGTVSVTYPARNATDIPINGLVVRVTAGAWTDGSAYSGSKTNIVIRKTSDDSLVYTSGWIDYTTSITVPDGTLSHSESYWIAAQHRATAAPASNPSASLESALPGKNDPQASVFTTPGVAKPDVSGLQHDIPAWVQGGSFTSVHIWGAVDPEGGTLTYKLHDVTGGMVFSKTSEIGENETLSMVAPATAQPTVTVTLNVTAVNSYGVESDKVPVTVLVLMDTEWIYTEDDTFKPPVRGKYKVMVGGGGGGGVPGSKGGTDSQHDYLSLSFRGAAGGGGCAVSDLTLNVQNYSVTVGKGGVGNGTTLPTAGGTSSFANLLSATGGQAADAAGGGHIYSVAGTEGGNGVGGDRNYKGGKGGGEYGFGPYTNNSTTNDYLRCCSGGGGAGPDRDGGVGKSPTDDSLGVLISPTGTIPAKLAGGTGGGREVGGYAETTLSVADVRGSGHICGGLIGGESGTPGIGGGGAGNGALTVVISGDKKRWGPSPAGGRGCVLIQLLEVL